MIFSFTGDLITQIQTVRHQNMIEKIAELQILKFSLNEWNNFSNQEEIKFNNNYYDVVSFKKDTKNVFAEVVQDDLENDIRVFISKIHKESKHSNSNKFDSNKFSKHLLNHNKAMVFDSIFELKNKTQKFAFIKNEKTSNFNNFIEKPPRRINFYSV